MVLLMFFCLLINVGEGWLIVDCKRDVVRYFRTGDRDVIGE